MKILDEVLGLDFTSPHNDEVYSLVALFDGIYPADYDESLHGKPIIEETCGNYIAEKSNGKVFYWDHESDDSCLISNSLQELIDSAHEPKEVELDESKVESVWIDPLFAKEMGLDVPSDGWKKKPKSS